MNTKTKLLLPILAAASLLSACKEKPAASTSTTPAAPSAELSKVLAASPAGEAKAIHVAKTTAKPGDEITLSGKIMGNENPFVAGRAVFILGDPSLLKPCNEIPGDTCKTPWDACCEPKEDIKAGTATVQINGTDGKVLKEGLDGIAGLKPLANVTITGKVAESSTADLLVVNATAIKVEK